MNDYFTIKPARKYEPTPLESNELFRGDSWSVYLEEQSYILGYISGEMSGHFKRIAISQSEAQQLIAGEVTCDSVLIRHDAS